MDYATELAQWRRAQNAPQGNEPLGYYVCYVANGILRWRVYRPLGFVPAVWPSGTDEIEAHDRAMGREDGRGQ